MNKHWYNYGSTFKVKFRNHYCYKCGERLTVVKHRKVVDQKTEEAKYYDFDAGGDGAVMVGPCEFIHKVFFCPNCSTNIEFVTQINLEDIDILIDSVQKYFSDKGRDVNIKKRFENINGQVVEEFELESISSLYLIIEEKGKDCSVFKTPITRKNYWERPFYFPLKKRKLISFIKNAIH